MIKNVAIVLLMLVTIISQWQVYRASRLMSDAADALDVCAALRAGQRR